MPLPYLLLDIDGVLIPFPAADGSTPPTHVRHTIRPTGRHPDDPVPIWLDPSQGGILADLLTSGLVAPAWCTSWRKDATTIIGPLLGLPDFPYLDLPRPQITTSHPNGYLWKRDHVDDWLADAPAIWIDDDFTTLDHGWASERSARGYATLLLQPDPYVGLQPAHLVTVQKWASLQGTPTECPEAVRQGRAGQKPSAELPSLSTRVLPKSRHGRGDPR